jgi:uncharacterized membrane protein
MSDFGIGTRYMGTDRQLGLTLHNGYRRAKHQYQLGVYTGVVLRPGFATGIARISKETKATPVRYVGGDGSTLYELHPAMVARYAHNANGIDNTTDTDWKRTGLRYMLGAALYYDFRPKVLRDFKARTGLEAMVKYRGFSVFGTFWTGFYSDRYEVGDIRFGMVGGTFDLGYMPTDWWLVALRYSFIATTRKLRRDSQQHAERRIAAASNDSEKASREKQFKGAGALSSDQELTLGTSFYPLGRNFKLGIDMRFLPQTYEDQENRLNLELRLFMQFYL